VERSDDVDSISIDMTDYSLGTTQNLIRQGQDDARRTIKELQEQGFNPSLHVRPTQPPRVSET
jgi:hypothetical protein